MYGRRSYCVVGSCRERLSLSLELDSEIEVGYENPKTMDIVKKQSY
jgi:hypothetical protein